MSNSKVNYDYGEYNEFGKPSSTDTKYEYNAKATLGKGDYTVSGTKYDDNGEAISAGSLKVNSSGTALSQTDYEADGNKSASVTLNNGVAAVSGSDSVSLKSGSYGFAATNDGAIDINGKNFDVSTSGALTLNNGTNNTLTVGTNGTLKNVAQSGENSSTVTNNYNGLTTAVKGNGNTVTSSTTYTGIVDKFVDADGTHSVTTNGDGTTFAASGNNGSGRTVINGGTITTGSTTITSDSITTKTLNVDKIVLGDKIVDKGTGNVIGGELEIGANGSIKIDNAGTDAVEFNATKTALSANYGGTSLNMNSNGFNLNNGTGENAASLVLSGSGFAFAGSVNLGKGSNVKYTGGNYGTLAKLDATVKDIYDRTDGIYKDSEGNTVISNEKGDWDNDTQKTKYTGEGSQSCCRC